VKLPHEGRSEGAFFEVLLEQVERERRPGLMEDGACGDYANGVERQAPHMATASSST
jgi:hypothetical protein